ncbi:MAG: hypothetical protein AAB352_03770 [Patescibacteria group bacterium]
MVKKYILILVAIFIFAASYAGAVSIKVSPSEIKIKTGTNSVKKEITIENPGNNVALFEVYVDNFSDWIKINPESFILNGGKSQKVALEIKNKETGIFSTMVSVVAKPLSDKEFSAAAGVKIPLEITFSEKGAGVFAASVLDSFSRIYKNQKYLIFLFLIIFIVFIFFAIIRLKKKQEK